MKKIILLLFAAPSMLFAAWGAGLSIHQVDDLNLGFGDLEFDVNTINVAYENRFADNMAFQAKFGLGLGDDSALDDDGDSHKFEVNRYFQLKGMYFLTENVYGALTYTDIDADLDVVWDDTVLSGSGDEFNFMVGYRGENFDVYFGPTIDGGNDEGSIVELGFTYFFDF